MTTDTDRDAIGPGGSTARGSPMRRRNLIACLYCRKRKIRCNAGEVVDVCDKCRSLGKPCTVLSVLCEDVIRNHNYEPENMSHEDLSSLFQQLVKEGHLSQTEVPPTFFTYADQPSPTFHPAHPFSTSTPPHYQIMHPNSTNYHVPDYANNVQSPYFNTISGQSDPRAAGNHPRALAVPGASSCPPPCPPASFTGHGNYPTHPVQGSFPFINQGQTVPFGYDVQQVPRGF